MDFSFSKEQKAIKKSVIDFAKNELNDDILENDRKGIFRFDNWKKCSEMGYIGIPIPTEYGGLGLDLVTTLICLEALSYGCKDSGLVHAIVTQICCALQILLFGSESIKKKFLKDIATGKIISAQALTEANAGSDLGAIQTNADRRNDKYVLTGSKIYISNGPVADLIIVFAATDVKKPLLGKLSCFIVEKEMGGFSSGKPLDKMGLRTLQNSEIFFDRCEVPIGNLIGKEGQGMFIFNEIIEWERDLMAACHLGTMERIFQTCVKYVKKRKQFGTAIGNFQSISNKIANMKSKIELGKLILYKAGWLKNNKKRATIETSIAKLFISEELKNICLDAIQIHGAYGFMKEGEIEKDLRDSIAATIYSGTSEMQKNIISSIALI